MKVMELYKISVLNLTNFELKVAIENIDSIPDPL